MERKRQWIIGRCIQASEHEAVQNSPDWENIPYTAAVQVFSYLRNKDRIKMAQVCRKWNNSFKDPSLWRKRKLVFDGKLEHSHILFTSLFGEYIQKVLLKIWHKDNTCKVIAESIEKVLENLKTARLRHFYLSDLKLEKFEMFPEQKKIFKRSLKEIFQYQNGLKTVEICSSHFDLSLGTVIMDNMATYLGHGLESLHLYNYFAENLPVYDLDIFKETLTKFKKLKKIKVNYSYISDEVLRHWAVSLHKLELMELTAINTEPHSHIITEETWRKLCASCPKLKVQFCIYYLSSANQILPLLQPSVPLNHLTMFTYEQHLQFSVTLKHLANCYGDRLEYMWISFHENVNSIDKELAHLIQRCRYQLQSFKFSGNFGIMVPNAIIDLLNDSRQSMLRTAEINYFGQRDPEIEKKIKMIGAILTTPNIEYDFDIYEDFPRDDIMM